ncbi:MAG: serpin family protein [Candidatus Sabulitectum sp.]|nr:serpin family protein [Candidatus Sabulitectum sp.]
MKILTGLLITAAAVLVIPSGCFAEKSAETQLTDAEAAISFVKGNNEFAFDLYMELCSVEETENVFFSPYSISAALGMTYSGAQGETALDMAETLHFGTPHSVTGRLFQSITEALTSGSLAHRESVEPFKLAISNGLWVQNGYALLDSFVSEVTGSYNASVENLDFAGNSEGSREVINSRVAESTMERILDLIPPGVLGADTRLVLTNAVYFKASWSKPFSEYATYHGDFFLADGSTVNVPVMTQTEHFSYAAGEGYSAVSMDYAGGSASMLIILPDGDLREFESSFDLTELEAIKESLSSQNIHISMPGFEFSKGIGLSEILSSLGMRSAFGNNADFSGITGNRDLYISDVVHKAFVKVDEEGTEAAAATAVVMSLHSIPESPVEMDINRPFFFLIQDNATGSIVFMGRVMNPAV